MNNKVDVCYLIDKDMNLFIIKEKTILELFDKKEISPLDILSQVDLLEDRYSDSNRYKEELEKKNYLALALYDAFTFWQESMAQDDEEYCNITEEEIWETIDKTIDDQQFTEEMWDCFNYYLNHNRKESEENEK